MNGKIVTQNELSTKMGFLIKLYDGILFLFFLAIALTTPLIDAQTCLPSDYFPEILVHLRSVLENDYGDYYFFQEKSLFMAGDVWIKLLFQWPLAVASLFAIVAGKSWLRTTSLIYGASAFTSVVTMVLTHKESEEILNKYIPYLVCTVLALLRGFLPHSDAKAHIIGKRPAINKKKRA